MKFTVNRASDYDTINSKNQKDLHHVVGCKQEKIGEYWYNTYEINTLEDFQKLNKMLSDTTTTDHGYNGMLIDFDMTCIIAYDYWLE